MRRYLLFGTELYALPILHPIAAAAQAEGAEVAWFLDGSAAAQAAVPGQVRLPDAAAVRRWRPDAVFSASNWVPHFFPGAKVQVFHGFSVGKRSEARGHFRIRGWFDLYCTQGPATTQPFQALADRLGHFVVAETGWPKLDPLFAATAIGEDLRAAAAGRPVVMYASTFTERLSSASALLPEIARQVAAGDRYWLLTLHPKTAPDLVARYRALVGPHARFLEADALVPMLRAADVLVCDTSSVVPEFALQGKPVVTFRNNAVQPYMIDIAEPAALEPALRRAFAAEPALRAELDALAARIHPYRDGRSSQRVLAATEALLTGRLRPRARKPANLLRKLQMRLWLRYFGRAG
ncbi:CDP-glycerol glycerophosphotransferase family protein [Dokdonella koreensis]|uniref:CDP-glycerol:poly(Glycerophosphate) glycerophosphotransferase n=1 Tax=Dokdonella koreensis DS-123 TaxID=1300342 RepID=A0A167GHI4_9GAMM|nr:CDP-glycerol glycerophosphotransferase family protein [Dokdonella koreensis]ANB16564.1 CDP-glycerol:poly(Glycerophosphate) glycerophosphotransferase [Dokdonella koreensis DS-123]